MEEELRTRGRKVEAKTAEKRCRLNRFAVSVVVAVVEGVDLQQCKNKCTSPKKHTPFRFSSFIFARSLRNSSCLVGLESANKVSEPWNQGAGASDHGIP